jgi:hypothetical protein
MQKEMTIFIICVLTLCADVLLLWQILNFRSGENLLIDSFLGGAILAALILIALSLLWFSYVLLRKIIDRTLE